MKPTKYIEVTTTDIANKRIHARVILLNEDKTDFCTWSQWNHKANEYYQDLSLAAFLSDYSNSLSSFGVRYEPFAAEFPDVERAYKTMSALNKKFDKIYQALGNATDYAEEVCRFAMVTRAEGFILNKEKTRSGQYRVLTPASIAQVIRDHEKVLLKQSA